MLKRTAIVFGASLLSGVLLRLSYPVPGWFPLAWVALVPWLVVVRSGSRRAAFWASVVTGLVGAGLGLSWQYLVTIVGGSLLTIYVGAYFVLFAWLVRAATRRLRVPFVVAAPVVWTGCEFFRGFFGSGFPWLFLGHTQQPWTTLVQVADLFGAYSLSFLVMACNAWVAEAVVRARQRPVPWRGLAAGAAFVVALVGGTLGYGAWRLQHLPVREGPLVGIVQANIPQDVKNRQTVETIGRIIEDHCKLTLRLGEGGTGALSQGEEGASPPPLDLVVWPETMVQLALNRAEYAPIVNLFKMLALRMRCPILVGAYAEVGGDPEVRAEADGTVRRVSEGEVVVGDRIYPLARYTDPLLEDAPLRRMLAAEGQRVRRGDPLAAFQSGDLQIRADADGIVRRSPGDVLVIGDRVYPLPDGADPASGERPLRRILVRDGQRVRQGDLLATTQSVVHNSAYLIRPGGSLSLPDRYDKNHLVPFGEFVPLRDLLWFLMPVVPYAKGFTPGSRLNTMDLKGARFGVLICFESVFSGITRDYVLRPPGEGADFLINISNDGWFQGSHELDQHLAICSFRAVEFRIGIVRSVNSGISAIIDPDGRIQTVVRDAEGRTKLIEGTAIGRVRLREGLTFYARHGDLLGIACTAFAAVALLAALLATVARLARRRGRSPQPPRQ